MKLGINAAAFGKRLQINMELVKHAERLGFDSAWTAEAYGNDAVTAATWIAAKTDKIKVGTSIMQMPGRAPAMTAMTMGRPEAHHEGCGTTPPVARHAPLSVRSSSASC